MTLITTTSNLPAPLVPSEVDLSDFQYMELDVRLLRDSKFAAETDAEAFRAGVLLWCAAWHQVPAASLPNNDVELSNLAGYGRVVKEWRKVREQALALFVLCSDGRLYHRVIADKAVTAWQAKLRHQHGKLLERLRKENKKREGEKLPPLPMPAFEQWNSERSVAGIPATDNTASGGIPAENALKGNGEGTERERNGEGTTGSVPCGTGGKPPPKPKSAAEIEQVKVWGDLKAVLVEQHACPTPKAAGEILGKHATRYGKDVFLDAARATLANAPVDAHTYLVGLCEIAAGKRISLGRPGHLTDAQRDAANDESDRQAKQLLFGSKTGETIDA